MGILCHLFGDVHHAQGEDKILHTVLLREGRALDEMARKVDMGSELAGEFEGLDQTLQLGHTPVKNGFGQLHGALGNPAPIGAVIVQGV